MQGRTVGASASISSRPIPSVSTPRTISSQRQHAVDLLVPRAVKEVFMPALSSTMTEGKVVSWLKNVGDKVKKGEPLLVVESDKADMDVESFSEGILAYIMIEEGDRADVGAAVAFVAETEADLPEAKKKGASMSGGAPAPAAAPAAAPAPPPAAAPAPVGSRYPSNVAELIKPVAPAPPAPVSQ